MSSLQSNTFLMSLQITNSAMRLLVFARGHYKCKYIFTLAHRYALCISEIVMSNDMSAYEQTHKHIEFIRNLYAELKRSIKYHIPYTQAKNKQSQTSQITYTPQYRQTHRHIPHTVTYCTAHLNIHKHNIHTPSNITHLLG